MHPYPFAGSPITSYGILLLLGLVLGWCLARRNARRFGVDPTHIDLLSPVMVLSGLGGAVLAGYMSDHLLHAPTSHSRVLLGGLLSAVLTGIGYCRGARIRLGVMGDVYAIPMLAGIALGRVGCFLAGCCHGCPCSESIPLAVYFPRGSLAFQEQLAAGLVEAQAAHAHAVYPVQLYEAAAVLGLAAVIYACRRRVRVRGEEFLAAGIGYAGLRFALEFLRADNPPVWLRFNIPQVTCVGIALIAVITLQVRRRMYQAI